MAIKLNLLKFLDQKTNGFYLLIGDEGIVFLEIIANKINNREFLSSFEDEKTAEIEQIILSKPYIAVTIILDISEQTYQQYQFPPVSGFNLRSLIEKRLEKNFIHEKFKAALPVKTDNKTQKTYSLVACSISKQHEAWIDFAENLPNQFKAIKLIPIEAEHLIRLFSQATQLESDNHMTSKWRLLVFATKAGGFRQILFYHNRVVFSRSVAFGTTNQADIVAGNVEQELTNTVEYLKRNTLKEDEKLDLIIIVNKEIKKYLSPNKTAYNSYRLLTSYEAAKLLNLAEVIVESDNFSDALLILTAHTNRKILDFATKNAVLYNRLKLSTYLLILAAIAVTIKLLISLGVNIYNLEVQKDKLTQLENVNNNLEYSYSKLKTDSPINQNDAEKKIKLVELYQLLSSNKLSPFQVLNILKKLKYDSDGHSNYTISSFTWKANVESLNSKPVSAPSAIKDKLARQDNKTNPSKTSNVKAHNTTLSHKENKDAKDDKENKYASNEKLENSNKIEVNIALNYLNNGQEYQQLLGSFDKFLQSFKDSFPDFEVKNSLALEQVEFGDVPKSIPVTFSINGPHNK